jgi:very-short-patch-repair endonuclease
VNAGQRSRAKRLRRELTPAERTLWHALKAHRFQALHMRRQVPMGPYIADFVCHRTRLIIELDGEQHGFAPNAAADELRDAWFAGQGYRVLRFWNAQVFKEFESVLETIIAAIQDESRGAHP